MGNDMDDFKKQLEKLKAQGANIEPEEIINELVAPPEVTKVEEFKESFDRKAFNLMRQKIDKLLHDFENHYGPKGCGLSVAIHVQKENSADRYSDTFTYIPDKLSVVHIVDIGTKGKYQPVVTQLDMIEEEKQKVKEREEKRKK